MAEYQAQRVVLAASMGLGAWLAGRAQERAAQFGVVSTNALKVGDCAPGFCFVRQDGQVETSAHVREVVTIVVFPVDPGWPNCDRCQDIVQIANGPSTPQSPVAVVSIVTPARPAEECAAAMHRCAVRGQSRLVALHDHAGRVRAMYGSQAAGKVLHRGLDGPNRGGTTAIGPSGNGSGASECRGRTPEALEPSGASTGGILTARWERSEYSAFGSCEQCAASRDESRGNTGG